MPSRGQPIPHESVRALAVALDAKDPESRLHSDRVARYAYAVGRAIGFDERDLEALVAAAMLHDIGVLAVPDSLLQRRDPLMPHELDVVREHAVIGGCILEACGLEAIASWVRHHHERIDGRGYPDQLAGDAIPIESRIIGVVEALEAITAHHERRASALDELEEHKGTQFDPAITDALIELIVSGDLERRHEDPPLLELVVASRIHDPEWVLRGRRGRSRLSSLPG